MKFITNFVILNSSKCALFKTPICLADIPLKTSYYFDSIDIRNKYSRLWSFLKQCDRDEKIRVHGIFLMCKPVVCTRINVHFFSTDKVCYIFTGKNKYVGTQVNSVIRVINCIAWSNPICLFYERPCCNLTKLSLWLRSKLLIYSVKRWIGF